jgi:hypothetical protein
LPYKAFNLPHGLAGTSQNKFWLKSIRVNARRHGYQWRCHHTLSDGQDFPLPTFVAVQQHCHFTRLLIHLAQQPQVK